MSWKSSLMGNKTTRVSLIYEINSHNDALVCRGLKRNETKKKKQVRTRTWPVCDYPLNRAPPNARVRSAATGSASAVELLAACRRRRAGWETPSATPSEREMSSAGAHVWTRLGRWVGVEGSDRAHNERVCLGVPTPGLPLPTPDYRPAYRDAPFRAGA